MLTASPRFLNPDLRIEPAESQERFRSSDQLQLGATFFVAFENAGLNAHPVVDAERSHYIGFREAPTLLARSVPGVNPAGQATICDNTSCHIRCGASSLWHEIMRVVKFTQNGQVALVPHNEAGKLADRNKSQSDPLQIINPTPSGLKSMKARQVRIDPLGRVFDPGPRE